MEYKTRFPQIEDVYLTEKFLDYEIQKSLKSEFSYQKHFNSSHEESLSNANLKFLLYDSINKIDKDRIERQIGEIYTITESSNCAYVILEALQKKIAYLYKIDEDSFTYIDYYHINPVDEYRLFHCYKFDLKYNEYEIVYCMINKLATCFRDDEKFHKEYNLYKGLFIGTEKEFLNCLIEPNKLNGYPNRGKFVNYEKGEFKTLRKKLYKIINNLSKEFSKKERFESQLNDLSNSKNQFNSMLMKDVIEHFKVFTNTYSFNSNEPYLTKEQFISFIERVFLGKKENEKQKFSIYKKTKGFVISRFYDFYLTAVSRYDENSRDKQKYQKMIIDSFDNWKELNEIESSFRANSTKNKW